MTPIFSASYSGLFKLFFDLVDRDAFDGKPVLLAATGGTARHSLAIEHAMRPLFAYLKADTVPTGVFAATEDWGASSVAMEGGLVGRIDRAAKQLATAMAARPPRQPARSLRRATSRSRTCSPAARSPRHPGPDRSNTRAPSTVGCPCERTQPSIGRWPLGEGFGLAVRLSW